MRAGFHPAGSVITAATDNEIPVSPLDEPAKGESEDVEIEGTAEHPTGVEGRSGADKNPAGVEGRSGDSEDWELVCGECEEGEDPSVKAKAGPEAPIAKEGEEHEVIMPYPLA